MNIFLIFLGLLLLGFQIVLDVKEYLAKRKAIVTEVLNRMAGR